MESRIRRNIYILLGVTFLLLVSMIAAWFFLLIRPQRDRLEALNRQYGERLTVAGRMSGALANQRKSEDRLRYLEGQLAFFRQRYRTLYFGDISNPAERNRTWRLWMREYFRGYANELRNTLVRAADATGVRLYTDRQIAAPPQTPEQVAAPANGLFRPLTTSALDVRIEGRLARVLSFLERINNESSILMTVGPVNITLIGAQATGGGAPTGGSPFSSAQFGGPGATGQATTPPGEVAATFQLTPYLLATGPGAPPSTSGLVAGAAVAPTGAAAPTGVPGAPPVGGPPFPPGPPAGVPTGAAAPATAGSS